MGAIARVNTQAEVIQTVNAQVDLDALISEAKPRTNSEILTAPESADAYIHRTHKL